MTYTYICLKDICKWPISTRTHKYMPCIFSYQRNQNQNYNKNPLHTHEDGYNKKLFFLKKEKNKERKYQVLASTWESWNPDRNVVWKTV